jgi:hypothetical protein
MSDIDAVLAQTYPHVAMLPYSSCVHCSYEEPNSPSSLTTFSSAETALTDSGVDRLGRCVNFNKRSSIRSRLRKFLHR